MHPCRGSALMCFCGQQTEGHRQCPGCTILYGVGHLAIPQGDGKCQYCARDKEKLENRSPLVGP